MNLGILDAHVGSRLRILRYAHDVSDAEFVSRFRISADDLAAIENGSKRMPSWLMINICNEYNVRSVYFFEGLREDEAPKDKTVVTSELASTIALLASLPSDRRAEIARMIEDEATPAFRERRTA